MNHAATLRSTRRRWTPLNILLMVIGFMLFWPLGLAMLAYIVWGEELTRMVDDAKAQFRSLSGNVSPRSGFGSATGNIAFDEYRQRELKRLSEERRKIEAMRAEFETFVTELRRAKDQEEFDRFMADYDKRLKDAEKAPIEA